MEELLVGADEHKASSWRMQTPTTRQNPSVGTRKAHSLISAVYFRGVSPSPP